MKQLFQIIIILSLGALLSCGPEKSIKKPNIILIMADDLGYEGLGCYGGTSYKTPVLDSLASTGIQFKHCISQPLCTPSRVKIMTGKYNYRNYDFFGHLNSDQVTFAKLLQNKGYSTCIAGKWQLNGLAYKDQLKDWKDDSRPHQFGFDEYCLWQLTQERKMGERYADPLIEQNGKILPRDKDAYGPDIFAQFVLDFIEKNEDNAFFVYYPMVLVHDPFVPTPDSENWADESLRYRSDTAYFGEMLTYSDKIVGKISDKLRELKLEDNTLLIFTGDNGTHRSIHSKTINGIIQGGKGQTSDAGTRVPLIVNWGNTIEKPFQYDGLIEFSDFYPTFAELVSEEVQSDGISFLPVLKGDYEKQGRKTAFVHYDPKWGKNVNKYRNQFVRSITYKLYQDGRFFNLEKDPLELDPLLKDSLNSEEVKIRAQLQEELNKHPGWKDF